MECLARVIAVGVAHHVTQRGTVVASFWRAMRTVERLLVVRAISSLTTIAMSFLLTACRSALGEQKEAFYAHDVVCVNGGGVV